MEFIEFFTCLQPKFALSRQQMKQEAVNNFNEFSVWARNTDISWADKFMELRKRERALAEFMEFRTFEDITETFVKCIGDNTHSVLNLLADPSIKNRPDDTEIYTRLFNLQPNRHLKFNQQGLGGQNKGCLLYTYDAADE